MNPNAAQGVKARRAILEYIGTHQAEHGWAPTVREIASHVGLASPASVQRHLEHLRDQGQLVLGGGPRMIRLTNGHIDVRPDPYAHVPPYYPTPPRRVADDGRLQPGR